MKGAEPAVEWLLANAGPILRWRMQQDWEPESSRPQEDLLACVMASPEVRRWLGNLGGRRIHGSKDTDAENAMAKLVEYGLRAGIPAFDAKMLPYAERMNDKPWDILSDTAGPFLIAAGYADHPKVRSWFCQRLDALYQKARLRDFDFYAPPDEAQRVPSAWRGKPIYKPVYHTGPLRLPSCYDLYAIAHWPHATEDGARKIRKVIAFLSDPRFQETPGGYLWDTQRNTCYAAGRTWLACLNEERKVLFLELTARFAECRRQPWFRNALAGLEAHRTDRGTYCFPADCLKEKPDSYYIYTGAHMGLGENRRKRVWRENESTFRMLTIVRLMEAYA